MSTFKLSDYDCIGFDLDHTLLWYNVTNMVEMEYQVLTKYLVTKKNYNPDFLQKPLTPKDIDFMQKGLVLDFDRGNILKPDSKGVIQHVNHGSTSLSLAQINSIYPNQRWESLDAFINNPLDVWEGPHSKKMRALMDYYDMPASLAFARAVDDIDSRNGGEVEKYEAWNDVTEALTNMYERGQFKKNLGEYFVNLKSNPDKYLRKCSQEIVSWLKELKKTRVTFLVTGSNLDFADFTATHTIGEDWRSLFDVIVCFAKKPGFFTGSRPFLALEGYEEAQEVKGDELIRGGIYSQGNWKELKSLFGKITGKSEPKCLYLGDNLIQDVFVPAGHAGLDTVVVSEEMHAEGMDHITLPHPDAETMLSNYWGSYFSVKINNDNNGVKNFEKSYWSFLIENYSKLCIPSIKLIARNPLDKIYDSFDKNDLTRHGYYPAKPNGLF
ncbi:5'-nucleotidase domain-containing protein 1 [Cotesia glomerata]|uniref:5'-nucleotidase domain-containing protein 1 n=1 Tax=Cotesia glomerata TaxID=32391 RepID=UPI001D009478|nr:5'-nucleotidase domain-containing protein 1 [Cotesia glomerata]XP_044591007.1 5'-nucleotidase domain-containing protein 1 [Cotesia glomerata]